MPGPGNRMRASRGHGRNMNSNQGSSGQAFGSSRPMQLASTGPLVTNHLQLHDLDLELALLKRKREMIEKQHTMLVSESRFGGGSSQYGFNEAPQSYGQRSEQTRNFSSFYNDGPGPKYDRFTTQQGVKRPAIDPWDNSAPTKRFNAPPAPKRASRYEPRPARSQPASQPPPLMSSSFRQRRPAPMSSRNNFKPTKVTKPRQNTAPNKLNSLPVAERKNLVNNASGLVQKTPEAFIYVPDKPAHPKLLGRLELALGTILREMREEYGDVEPHNTTFINMGQRALKQAIRERIHTIMLGKPVGAGAEVVALYRKEHPKDTDVELLNKARGSIVHMQNGNLAIEIIKQGNPERYFRNNFRRLLSFSLDEMFDRVQKLYTTVDTSDKPLQDVINSLLVDVEKSMLETKEEEPSEVSENITENVDDQTAENTEMNTSEVNNSDENGAEVDTNATSEEACVQPDENAAKSDEKTAETDEKTAETDEKAAESGEKAAESDEKAPNSKENVENPGENTAKSDQNGDTPVKNAGTSKRGRQSDDYVRERFYNRLMETMMKRHLPVVLPRYKDFIMRIINTDNAFKETKAFLIKTTNERVDEIANKKATSPTKNTAGSEKQQLFVKVMGRPALPKKKLMKTFLDTFHPTLIKKHRNVHNILFVSFDNKENFENILAKNGTVISSCKLDIKVSEKINRNRPNEAKKPNGDTQEAKPNDSDVEIIEPKSDPIKLDGDIDEQISDLLSTIRDDEGKDDEPKKEGDEIEVKEEEPANNEGETQDSQNSEQVSEPEKMDDEPEKMDDEPEKKDENKETEGVEAVQVEAVKNETTAKATPTRSSARLTSTPSAVRTRRASKLTQ